MGRSLSKTPPSDHFLFRRRDLLAAFYEGADDYGEQHFQWHRQEDIWFDK